MKKNDIVTGSLENIDGTFSVTELKLLTPVSIAGTAAVRVLKDEGNLHCVQEGSVLRGFHLTNGVIKFKEVTA